MAIDISQFYQVFFEETREHLQEIEKLLLKLDIERPDLDQLNAIFRAAHSIKGGSATFGFNDITSVTHVLESLLDRLRKKELDLQPQMIDVFLHATDVLNIQLNGHVDGTPAEATIADEVTNELIAFSSDINLLKTDSAIQTKADDGFGFFDDANQTDDGFGFFETEAKKPVIDDSFGLFEPISEPSLPKTSAAQPIKPDVAETRSTDRRASDRRSTERTAESSSIRVDVAKVDQLINLVGELVITEAMLVQGLSNAPAALLEALNSNVAQLQRNTRDLQEVIMSVRMMPISNLFTRFPRLVRDLASKLKKEVELVTVGEETELDKSLIEQIADPLTHLIRNSLDHGIESPAARKAAGKPAKGKVTLSAMHQGGSIMIEVIDDGAGLNQALIIKKAKQNGLSLPSKITDESLWDIICMPGFSTAASITDVSGRGVGMDVVNRNIADLGGQISISSDTGKGCKISIRLPLTLAILDGMTVSLGENLFVLPLNTITETMQAQQANLKSVSGEGAMIKVRDEYLPVILMYKTLNIATQITEITDGMLVIVEAYGKKAALLFDGLVGQQQVVIKSLETNFRKISGISGATIMGDGTVALIIDVPTIVKIGQASSSSQNSSLTKQTASTSI
jgi:two-component system, chemotaxis family, sensor kinase CheA